MGAKGRFERGDLDRRERLALAIARLTWRRIFIRLVAVLTCLVALVGIWASASAYRQAERAEGTARAQLLAIGDTFGTAGTALRTISGASTNAAGSAEEAGSSLAVAARTTRDAAQTLDETAGVINFTIPGFNIRPLAGVDTNFREQARQLRSLADQVERTGGAVSRNQGDLQAISRDVATMATEMDEAARQVRDLAGPTGPVSEIAASARLLISWGIVLHVVILAVGVALYLLTLDPPPVRERS